MGTKIKGKMDIGKVLIALKYRLKNLKKVHECMDKNDLVYIARDYEIRIDEIESLCRWIKESDKK